LPLEVRQCKSVPVLLLTADRKERGGEWGRNLVKKWSQKGAEERERDALLGYN